MEKQIWNRKKSPLTCRTCPYLSLLALKLFAKLPPIKYTAFRAWLTSKSHVTLPCQTWRMSKIKVQRWDLELCSTIQISSYVAPACVTLSTWSVSQFMLDRIRALWKILCKAVLKGLSSIEWWVINFFLPVSLSASCAYSHLPTNFGGTKTGTVKPINT